MRVLNVHRWLVAVCLLFFLGGILRLNDLSLYTDSSRYLIWGTSFAQLKGFVDETQPDADRYVVNAPLYSVLLAPSLAIFPLSITAAKVWTLLWACLALVLFYILLLRLLGKHWALLGTFMLAVNPLTLILSTEVLSEAPFLASMFFMIILIDEFFLSESPRMSVILPLLTCAGLVVVLREVAISFVGALAIALLVRNKAKYALLVLGCAVGIYGLWLLRNLALVGETPSAQSSNLNFVFQHALTPADAPLHEEVVARLKSNISGYGIQLSGMLLYPVPPNLILGPGGLFRSIVSALGWGKFAVIPIVLSLTFLGLVVDVRDSRSGLVRILFLLLYLVIILTYPIHDIRFLFPLLPFMIFYIMKAGSWTAARTRIAETSIARNAFIVVFLVATIPDIVYSYEIVKTNVSYRKSPVELYKETKITNPDKTHFSMPWQLAGSWIQEHIPENTVIASSAKEIAAFVGNRKVLEINSGVPLPIFEFMLRDHAVDYVLGTGLWSDLVSYELLMRESNRFWFEEIFAVADLHLFKVHSAYLIPSLSPKKLFPFDTVTAAGLLRKGRFELITESYQAAIQSLKKSSRLQPNQPEPIFQLFLAYTFLGDSAEAIRQVRQMFTKARSTPYVWAAQVHLTAMNDINRSKTIQNVILRSNQVFDVGRLYWNLGFRRQAYRLMQHAVDIDPSYFVGMLWAWHYGIQLADTARARTYLRSLERIDKSNAVVKSFLTMTSLSDTLRHTKRPYERSRLRLSIAAEYEKMELPEEAIDETERAIGEDKANSQGWIALGKLFEEKNKLRAARRAFERALEVDPTNPTLKSRLAETK